MSQDIVSDIKRDYIMRLLNAGTRIDNRKFDETREVHIETGVIGTAEGSARVRFGRTDVMVGIKMDVGEPYPDTPNTGVMTTNAELVPMASPTFESGPRNPVSIEVARVIDRGIRESKLIDLEKLVITPGEKVWVIFIDIHVLDYDGNIFDVGSLAALTALRTAVVPASRFELGEDFPMPVNGTPVMVTMAKVGSHLLVDPNLDEEGIAEGRISICLDENNHIRAMQKGLVGAFTREEVMKALDLAKGVAPKVRSQIPP